MISSSPCCDFERAGICSMANMNQMAYMVGRMVGETLTHKKSTA